MPLEMEAAKKEIVDFCHSKSKSKSKFYFNDFTKLFPDAKAREVKKILTALVNEGVMIFWSSGSTTMYGLAGEGKQTAGEGEG
ncbi:Dissimilatory sulfite reductase D (DsrD) [Paucidesulfovibrio gracilis DSM 16080]|uniref:Dissimilatory sulfite reductase D (DsrD) n=2 Tax=Paucidesulfovibrio TaxID=2910985 RepID=A0A1T4WYA6_9BACT|nr:Dissimilatory sulfite reductase D (DsrD) [Paucidesulfovibrio gracilis DSM 16080]